MVAIGALAIVIAFVFWMQIDKSVEDSVPSSKYSYTTHATKTVSKPPSSHKTEETIQQKLLAPISTTVPESSMKQPSAVIAVRIEPELESTRGPEVTIDEKVQKVIQWFKQTNSTERPLIQRPVALDSKFKELAQQGDEVSTRVLMAFAMEENVMVSTTAISALGMITKSPLKNDIVKCLQEKLKQSGSISVKCATLEALARVGGDSVIDELRNYILINWDRHDGWGERIATAVVKGMSDVKTYKAAEFLVLELMRADSPDWLYEYGSAVVDALRKYRHPLVKQALIDYAVKIDNRMKREIGAPHEYLKGKFEEVHKAIAEQEQ